MKRRLLVGACVCVIQGGALCGVLAALCGVPEDANQRTQCRISKSDVIPSGCVKQRGNRCQNAAVRPLLVLHSIGVGFTALVFVFTSIFTARLHCFHHICVFIVMVLFSPYFLLHLGIVFTVHLRHVRIHALSIYTQHVYHCF